MIEINIRSWQWNQVISLSQQTATLHFRLIACCEFLSGTYKQSKEMGSRWIDEIKEDFQFAMLGRGDTKVLIIY